MAISIVDIVPTITPAGIDITQPLSFAVSAAIDIISVGVSVRYLRDKNTYMIYTHTGFAPRYAAVSSVSGIDTKRIDFTVFEFNGWRGEIRNLDIFGIDLDSTKFLFSLGAS